MLFSLKNILSGGSNEPLSDVPESKVKRIKDKTNETAKNLAKIMNETTIHNLSIMSSNTEVLNNVYKMMVILYNDERINRELQDNSYESREIALEKRHKTVLKSIQSLSFSPRKKTISTVKEKTQEQQLARIDQKVPPTPGKPPTETMKPPVEAVKPPKEVLKPPKEVLKPPKEVTKPPKEVTKPPTKTVKPPKQTPKQTTPAKPAEPPPKVGGPPAIPSVGKGAAAAAAVSIAGETYAKDPLHKKVGQVVANDPNVGHYSYGMFGMNSKSKTIDQFVQENPQFGFKEKPGTTAFNEEFKKIGNERTQEMYDAQMAWYEKYVYNPTVKNLKNYGLPANIANDDRVVSYMSDRLNQMGHVAEKSAIKAASAAKTPEEFIDAISSYDLKTIETSFPDYLSKYKGKERENQIKALANRIEKRRKLSQIAPPNTSGLSIEKSSVENKDLNEQLTSHASTSTVINQSNYNTFQSHQRQAPAIAMDDRSAYERKSRT